MKISKRLETIANLIPRESKVIDVGCDHALLDIYLSQEKNCCCLATDVNQNALEQAKYNIKRFHIQNIQTVLTDGLEGILVHPSDIIVISGMGTETIRHILDGKTTSDRMIIGTHTDFEDLRRYVVSLGYQIQDEKYIEEKGKSYIIIDFVKGDSSYTEEDYLFGPILKKNMRFIENERERVLEILEQIPTHSKERENKKHILNQLDRLRNKD